MAEKFPLLDECSSVSNPTQNKFSFVEDVDSKTVVTMASKAFHSSLDQLRIRSVLSFNAIGYINKDIDGERRRLAFTSYNADADFNAYHDKKRRVLIIPQGKKICKEVRDNLNKIGQIQLYEMLVDFKVFDQVWKGPYLGAWFRKVSPNLNAVGMVGNDIQDDRHYKNIDRIGELSNVTIPFIFEGANHPIMFTSSGAIVLISNYKGNCSLELDIVLSAFDKLVLPSWSLKPVRGKIPEIDIPAEP